MINSNMRCIETLLEKKKPKQAHMINSNMRCIETTETNQNIQYNHQINSNMRCIETKQKKQNRNTGCRLIVTWDVLKLIKKSFSPVIYID